MKRLGLRLALAGGSLLVTLAALEIVVRLFFPQLPIEPHCVVLDPVLVYRLKPDCERRTPARAYVEYLRTNSRGLREREIAYEKRSGTLRILALGDSFTFGSPLPVEASWPKALERRLRADGAAVEVVNAGVFGYTTYHELRFLETEGLRYAPDIVVLQVYLWNDVDENRDPTYALRWLEEARRPMRRLKDALRRNLHAYRLLGDRWNLMLYTLGARKTLPPEIFRREWSDASRQAFELTLRTIADLHALAASRGIHVLVVDVPDRAQVDDDLWRRYRQGAEAVLDEAGRARPARLLAEFLAGHGIPALDLGPTVREALRTRDVYARYDPHFNEAGSALAAEAIAAAFQARGWVPGRKPTTIR